MRTTSPKLHTQQDTTSIAKTIIGGTTMSSNQRTHQWRAHTLSSTSTTQSNEVITTQDQQQHPRQLLKSFSASARGLSRKVTTRRSCNRRRILPTPPPPSSDPSLVALSSNAWSSSQKMKDVKDNNKNTSSSSSSLSKKNGPRKPTIIPAVPSKEAAASRIRSKYLYRLGVVGPSSPAATITTAASTPPSPVSSPPSPSSPGEQLKQQLAEEQNPQRKTGGSCIKHSSSPPEHQQQPNIITVSLSPPSHSPISHHRLHANFLACIQEDECKTSREDEHEEQHQDETSMSGCSHRSMVSFDSSVTVHLIPKHDEYSPRVRNSIWTDPQEMQENATRNSIEFAAENWDWRQSIEEKDMVVIDDPRSPEPRVVHPVHVMRKCNLQRQFLMIMSAQRQF